MLLTKRVIIPELDEPYAGQLVDILRDWEKNDGGGSVVTTLGGVICEGLPPVLKAYMGRKRQGDKGLFNLPRFGDYNVIEAMRRLDISLSSSPALLRGSFCVDLERGVLGYCMTGDQPSSRDEYRSENPDETYVIGGTAIDIARELTLNSGFDLRRFTTGDQGRHVDFLKSLTIENLQKY